MVGKVSRYEDFISLFEARHCDEDDDKRPHVSFRVQDRRTLQKLMFGYAATFGIPTCCLIPELLATFPQAKLILHVRYSDKEWYKSFSNSIGLDFERGTWRARVYRFLTLSIRWMHPHHRLCDHMAEYWREVYDGIGPRMHSLHNARMKALVPKERLLVYDVKEGWEPLCTLLNVPVPDVPFPRVNDAMQMQRIYLYLHIYGAAIWLLIGGLVGTSLLLLLRWR